MESLKNMSYILALLLLAQIVIADGEGKCSGGGGSSDNTETASKEHRHRIFDQDFGLAITPDDFLTSMIAPIRSPLMFPGFHDYFRPWRHLAAMEKDIGSTIKMEKDKFQINLDVQHFSPNEITVKTADGYIVVEGKHQEKKDDHGYISRQFVRRYALPEGAAADAVMSQLSADGVLTISAPRKQLESKERIVPITQTGPVRQETCDKQQESGSCQTPEK